VIAKMAKQAKGIMDVFTTFFSGKPNRLSGFTTSQAKSRHTYTSILNLPLI